MGKKPAISTEKRAQIVSLSTMMLAEREIYRQMKVSKTAVHNAIKKFQNEVIFEDSQRSDHPRVSSSRDGRVIRKIVSQFPISSAKKILVGMAERGIKISEKIVSDRFSMDFGLKSYRPAQKPRLSEGMKRSVWSLQKNILTGTQRYGKMFCFQINPQ